MIFNKLIHEIEQNLISVEKIHIKLESLYASSSYCFRGDAEGREKHAFLWRRSCQGSVLLHVMKMVTFGRKLRRVIVHDIDLHCLGNYSCLACTVVTAASILRWLWIKQMSVCLSEKAVQIRLGELRYHFWRRESRLAVVARCFLVGKSCNSKVIKRIKV